MEREKVLKKFLTGIPQRFDVAGGNVQLNAVVVDIDDKTGVSVGVSRIKGFMKMKPSRGCDEYVMDYTCSYSCVY